MSTFLRVVSSALVFSAPFCLTAAEYYVSLTGDDANNGSAQSPFRTPCYALSKAVARDTVYFYPGEYCLTNTPQIKATDITLQGLGATREDVILNADGQFRCLDIGFTSSGNQNTRLRTKISGITFKNGYVAANTSSGNTWGSDFGAGVRLAFIQGSVKKNDNSVVTNCAFVACTNLYSYGGAVNAAGGATFVDCLFKDNYASAGGASSSEPGGAALHLQPGAAGVTIRHCQFENNVCANGYSVIAAGSYQGTLDENEYGIDVTDCTFSGNRSLNSTGGEKAFPLFGRKVREVVKCTFSGNRGESCSSGSAVSGCILSIGSSDHTNRFFNCAFEGNRADGKGGCFNLTGKNNLILTKCVFTGNVSEKNGAVVYCSRAGNYEYSNIPVIIEDCKFDKNMTLCDSAYDSGGIVTIGRGSRVLRSTFTGNATYGWCGVIESIGNTNLVIDSCSFVANVIRPQLSGEVFACSAFVIMGGVSGISDAMPEMRNCLFACNTNLEQSTKGRVVYIRGPYSRIHNCTMVGQRSAESDADNYGLFTFSNGGDSTGYEVRNCLFADNRTMGSNTSNNGIGRAACVRSCAEDADSLNVNTNYKNIRNATMYFMDAAKSDYRPTKKTPGRDLGMEFAWMTGAKDLSGETDRIVNEIPDFGCYEWIRIPSGLLLIVR